MVDRELLHCIDPRSVYITTDKGYIFLDRRQQPNTLQTNSKIVDKPKEEQTVKTELSPSQSYMTTKQDNDNNVNPFAAGTAVWQSLMIYWLNGYGEFLKNTSKMSEQWYNIYYKPWVDWMAQQQRERQNRV